MKSILCLVVVVAVGAAIAQEKPNPFTGTTAAFEQRLRLLEERKLDAAIASEELAAEKSNQERLRIRAGRPLGLSETTLFESSKSASRRPPSGVIAPVPPATPATTKGKVARLVGTISAPTGWIALVESGDRIVNVPEGMVVEGIRAIDIGKDKATINGTAMSLETVVARVAAPAPAMPAPAGRPPNLSVPVAIPTAPPEAIDLATPAFRK